MEFKPFELYKDPVLDSSEFVRCEKDLSIRYSPDGFSFSISLPGQKKFVALGVFSFTMARKPFADIKDFFRTNALMREAHFNNITLIHPCREFTFVPDELYHSQNAIDYLGFTEQDVFLEQQIHAERLQGLGLWNIYAVNNDLESFLTPYAEQVIPVHAMTRLLCFTSAQQTEGNVFFVNIEKSYLQTAVYFNGTLQSANLFEYSSREDIAYYLLLICSQLKISPSEVRFIFYGNISQEGEDSLFFKKFTGSFNPGKRWGTYWHSRELDNIPVHAYYDILNKD